MSLDHGKYLLGETFTYRNQTKSVFNTAGKIPEFGLSHLHDLIAWLSCHFLGTSFRRLMKQRASSLSGCQINAQRVLHELGVVIQHFQVIVGQGDCHRELLLFLSHLHSLLKIPPLKLKKTKTAETIPASLLLGNKKLLRGSSLGQLVSSVKPKKTNNDDEQRKWLGWATP